MNEDLFESWFLCVMGMQEFVGAMSARFMQEVVVERLDLGVLVRLAMRHADVFVVERLGAQFHEIDAECVAYAGVDDRLTASVDASARATHDFDEGVGRCAGTDFIQQGFGQRHAVGDGDFDFHAGEIQRGFLDAFDAADAVEVDVGEFLAGQFDGDGA